MAIFISFLFYHCVLAQSLLFDAGLASEGNNFDILEGLAVDRDGGF
jgi:hypothetical protein